MRRLCKFLLLVSLLIIPQQFIYAGQDLPSKDEVTQILQERVDKLKQTVGIVVGMVSEDGSEIYSFGKSSQDNSKKPDGDTLFETGSITKVFTSLLLADMVERGEMNLDDPISKYLPESVKVPTRDGKEITLRHLAAHTSGLPRIPDNFVPADMKNPYADYTVEDMYKFLSGYSLPGDIGEKYEYSNLGGGLLGHILALKAGTDYETLVKTRICEPLKMDSTVITLSSGLKKHLATGHDPAGNAVSNWDFRALAGAGALRSTAKDMLKFVAANLGLLKSGLYSVMQKTHIAQVDTGIPNLKVGLAWHILDLNGTEIVWHNGGTGGYHSFIGFVKKKGIGVVVLSNSANDIDDIGIHLLDNSFPLKNFEPAKGHTEIEVDPEIYNTYEGRYELAPNVFITINRSGNALYVQVTGQQELEIYPESESKFFLKVVDAQIQFNRNNAGEVESLTLLQNGQKIPAKKLD